jgi:hypothetical protein
MRAQAQYRGKGGPGKFDTMRLHAGGMCPSTLNRASSAPIAARRAGGVNSASYGMVSCPRTRFCALATRVLAATACSLAIGFSIVVANSTSIAVSWLAVVVFWFSDGPTRAPQPQGIARGARRCALTREG